MNSELRALFEEPQKNPYTTYGFQKNPFPTNAQESYKICYNQEEVKNEFMKKLKSFIIDQHIATLLIDAEHRVGKTNFLLHYFYELKDISEISNKSFKVIYIRNYGDNYLVMHKALVEMLGESLFLDILNKLKDKKDALETISDTDFKKGLLSCIKTPNLFGFDPNKVSLFFEWFMGLKCTQKELKEIEVFSNITTSSLAIRYLRDLITISRSLGIMNSLMVFMDEFELIFGASVSRAKRDKYLQDLRSLIEEIQTGIFIVGAITPAALVSLSKDYPALKARFGESNSLSPIRNAIEAQAYAYEYINFSKQEYEKNIKSTKDKESRKSKSIIEKEDILKIYNELANSNRSNEQLSLTSVSGDVKQGFFFEKLHLYVEEKISKSP